MRADPAFLLTIQPIVLVGGKSSRFGRDKLREQVGDGLLIDHPIAALRAVFGPRVKLVGDCHPDVASRANGTIDDRYVGAGPMGGILSALEAWNGPVFVLPGDLPGITDRGIRLLVDAAPAAPHAVAITARGDRTEPCIGIYRPAARERMARRIADHNTSLHDLLPDAERIVVALPTSELVNVNRPGDLSVR